MRRRSQAAVARFEIAGMFPAWGVPVTSRPLWRGLTSTWYLENLMNINLTAHEIDILLDALMYGKMAEEQVLALDTDPVDKQEARQRMMRIESISTRLEAEIDQVDKTIQIDTINTHPPTKGV